MHSNLIFYVHFLSRWFDWEKENKDGVHKLGVKHSDRILTQLQHVGQQLALAFNQDGSVLATGGEVGTIFHFVLHTFFLHSIVGKHLLT